MIKQTMLNKNRLVLAAAFCSGLAVAGYAVIYQQSPFSEFVNALILHFLTILPALACALLISRVALYFERGERLRRIWVSFAVGLWLWAIAEIIWAIYDLVQGSVPNFSPADVLWIGAYVFLADALSNQFGLVTFDRSRRPVGIGLTVFSIVFASAALITVLTGGALEDFSGYFYPLADFAVGLVALILVVSFRRGRIAWPWLSLLVFMISDSLYAWAVATGVYEWSTGGGALTLLIDLIYILAYLMLSWGVFNQYLAIRFAD